MRLPSSILMDAEEKGNNVSNSFRFARDEILQCLQASMIRYNGTSMDATSGSKVSCKSWICTRPETSGIDGTDLITSKK